MQRSLGSVGAAPTGFAEMAPCFGSVLSCCNTIAVPLLWVSPCPAVTAIPLLALGLSYPAVTLLLYPCFGSHPVLL